MKTFSLAVACAVVFGVSAPADDAAKDLEKLQGTWTATEITVNGKTHTEGTLRFTFKKDQVIAEGDDEVKRDYAKVSIKLDPSTKPACIDIHVMAGEQKGAKMEGIYELKGDDLKICVKLLGNDRPTEFKAPDGSNTAVLILKRDK